MPGRYENDFPGDAVTEQDGDGFFIGLDSRSEPENLQPGIVSVAQNMRFNQRKAVVRAGMEKQTNDISFPNIPLIIPFVLTTPAPVVRNVYSNGIFESCVYSDQATNDEFIAVATAEAAFLFRPGETVVQIDYPANELITGADQVDMFQATGSLYILRGMSTATAAVTSITSAVGTATVTTTANHGLVTGQYAKISGAVETPYNGVFPVTVTGLATFTYTVTGAPASPATGTILWAQVKPALRWDGVVGADFIVVPFGTISSPFIYMPASDFGLVMQNRGILQYTRNQAIVSEVLDVEQYDSIYGTFTFREGEADFLLGFHPYQDNECLVFNRRSIYIIGEIDGDVNVMPKRELTRQIGCVSRRSIATCGQFVMFLSDNGVYVLQPGLELQLRGNTEPLSAAVQNVIDTINTAAIQSAYGIYFNNRYYLAIPINSSTRNNTMIVYNFLNSQWESVDTFPTEFRCDYMEVINDGMRDALYLISLEGGIYEYEVLEVDEYGAADQDPADFLIAGNLVTRRYIFSNTDLKRFTRLACNLKLHAAGAMTISVLTSNPDDTKVVLTRSTVAEEDVTARGLLGVRAYGAQLQFQNTATRGEISNYQIQAYTQDRKSVSIT